MVSFLASSPFILKTFQRFIHTKAKANAISKVVNN